MAMIGRGDLSSFSGLGRFFLNSLNVNYLQTGSNGCKGFDKERWRRGADQAYSPYLRGGHQTHGRGVSQVLL